MTSAPAQTESTAVEAVRSAASAAAAASGVLRTAPDDQISGVLSAAAARLPGAADAVLAANAEDVAAAEANGMSEGLLDRLRLDPARLEGAAQQLVELAGTAPAPRLRYVRDLPEGSRVFERRVPVGVIGATYEARPAVTLDVAGQVLRARSAAVLRTGSAALRTAAVLVDEVLAPALAEAGLPAGAVALVREPGHAAAEALVTQPDLLPLVIVRGSGDTTRRLSALGAAAGVRVLAHADGGGVLYADASTDPARFRALLAAGVDRLGVCNRLNLLLLHRERWDELSALAVRTLADAGVQALLPPHEHRLGHEWALDSGREATVTVAPVDGPVEAAALASRETSGIAATVCAEDEAAAVAFLGAWDGTGGFWNTTTRLLDGYKLLGVPETGISVDRVPGPRGPVTFPDLALRQFVIVPPGENSVIGGLEG
ncbi:glutamate-5-semialdehyde dehydrogenase [Kineococcus xinjiangensis]|uniref:Glutamate-5-semialdehyde dehydrogenase n=1 Tax=Kineococcus xinjiangensis TaxID=512762 RepID=A0A2S6IHZ8_9ACTN|nr:aldehyde dehydrogenase family protein [Kineococcus xinjiangensis]PPK93806.1 glutamate-5-semialdehyde dehydrogenase [Kineococcus xinjiangensis]